MAVRYNLLINTTGEKHRFHVTGQLLPHRSKLTAALEAEAAEMEVCRDSTACSDNTLQSYYSIDFEFAIVGPHLSAQAKHDARARQTKRSQRQVCNYCVMMHA